MLYFSSCRWQHKDHHEQYIITALDGDWLPITNKVRKFITRKPISLIWLRSCFYSLPLQNSIKICKFNKHESIAYAKHGQLTTEYQRANWNLVWSMYSLLLSQRNVNKHMIWFTGYVAISETSYQTKCTTTFIISIIIVE